MSQGIKKITRRKITATNNESLVRTSSLIQPALFLKILTTNFKILVRTSTGTRGSSFNKTRKNMVKYSCTGSSNPNRFINKRY